MPREAPTLAFELSERFLAAVQSSAHIEPYLHRMGVFRGGVWAGLLVALMALCVYVATSSPSVGYEDSGELAAAAYVLGVPHPPGYPLFALIGKAISLFPFDMRVIRKLNVFNALTGALAAWLVFRLFLSLLSGSAARLFRKGGATSSGGAWIAAGAAALVFAFSRTFWAAAVSLEVHVAHLVLVLLATELLFRALASDAAGKDDIRPWLLFAYVLGLGFSHHPMIALLLPAFLYAHFSVLGHGRRAWMRILIGIPPFLLALTSYLYLPVRASLEPVMNWGAPSTPESFWWHVTARQFHNEMFASGELPLRKLALWAQELPAELGYAPLVAALAGAWVLFRARERRLGVFWALVALPALVFSVNYDFEDSNFYLHAHLTLAFLAAVFLYSALSSRSLSRRRAAGWACLPLAAFPLALHYARNDKNRDYVVEDYARNVLASVGSGGILFSQEYRRLGAPASYLQVVEGYRADVTLLNVSLMESPWYYRQLRARDPALAESVRNETEAYLLALRARMDPGGAATAGVYHSRLFDLHRAIIARNLDARPVHLSAALHAQSPTLARMPAGMTFRFLTPGAAWLDDPPGMFPRHRLPPEGSDPVADGIRREYADGYAHQGAWRIARGDTATGLALLRAALEIVPGQPGIADWVEQLSGPAGTAAMTRYDIDPEEAPPDMPP